MSEYAPLWCKSNFSFLEGASHTEELVEEAHRIGLRSIAITDRDGVYGLVRAHTKAKELGIQLVCGAQLTIAPPTARLAGSPITAPKVGLHHGHDGHDGHDEHAEIGRGPGWGADTDDLEPAIPVTGRRGRPKRSKPRQAVLGFAHGTAANEATPVELPPSRLVVLASDRAGWANLTRLITIGRRRCDKGESLLAWSEICEHAQGLVALWEDLSSAELEPSPQLAGDLRAAFGDRLYAPLSRHRRAADVPREVRLRARAATFGIPLVVANEVLYHSRARRPLQDVLTCIRHGVTLATAGRWIRGNDEHDLRPPHAFGRLFADDRAALARTLEIAARCSFTLGELRYRYPSERLPDGSTSAQYLRRLVAEGAAWRYGGAPPANVRAQLDTELVVIEELDYPGYFLTMFEIVSYCRRREILCQGRGSAANSAVCFCLGVTAVDPVRMGLLFERFLSRERAEPPDIDLDIEHERREEVIQHVYEVYGRDRAAMVCNVIRYRPRSAVRDVGKVLGIPETALDRAAKHLSMHGQVETEALARSGLDMDARGGHANALEHLARLADEILEFPRHLSVHPGGFLLGHEPVHDIVPIENATMPGRTVIQWDKDDLDELALFKVDLLGLGALHQLHLGLDMLRAYRGVELSMATIPAEDSATYDMICTADTVGTFQIESRAQMAMLPRLKPRTFYDLVVEVSLVRPGPISGGMVHPYLRRRAGLEKVEYPHPCLEPVLAKTLGVPLFQEQVMKLAVVAADYTPGEADQLRRDMAAWRRSGRIEKHRERLIGAMEHKGIAREFGERVFEQIRGFGEYGFPESHAASFALIAYATCWMRKHYLPEVTASLLNAQPMGFYSPATIVGDARRHGLEVRPIDVQVSAWECTLEPAAEPFRFAVRMGLRWVKGLQLAEGNQIIAARSARRYESLEDFVRRSRVPARIHEALAEAGALGGLIPEGQGRRDALWQTAGWVRRQDEPLELGGDVHGEVAFEALTQLDEIFWDYASSDHSTRGHPLQPLRGELRAKGWPDARTLNRGRDGQRAEYVGIVICRQQPGTAAGVVFMTLEDETGFVNLVVWAQVFAEFATIIKTTSLLGVTGRLQVQEGIVHMIAERVWHPALTRPVLEVDSRDFH
ncbi:MAG: error-prone DNA polymerase [Kofleriaceae bacterium]